MGAYLGKFDGGDRSAKKKPVRKFDISMISGPSNFQHVDHHGEGGGMKLIDLSEAKQMHTFGHVTGTLLQPVQSAPDPDATTPEETPSTDDVAAAAVEEPVVAKEDASTQVETPGDVKDASTQVETLGDVKDASTQVETLGDVKDASTQVETPANVEEYVITEAETSAEAKEDATTHVETPGDVEDQKTQLEETPNNPTDLTDKNTDEEHLLPPSQQQQQQPIQSTDPTPTAGETTLKSTSSVDSVLDSSNSDDI